MTASQSFTSEELRQLDDIESAKSGTTEDQFIQECIELVRNWLETRQKRKDPAPPDTQSILFIFAEAPDIELGFDNTFTDEPIPIRKKMGTLGEGIVVCNQNFRVMRKVCKNLTIDDAYNFVESKLSSNFSFIIAKVGQFQLQIHRAGQDLGKWLEDPDEVSINIDDIDITPELIADDIEKFHHRYLSTPVARAARHMWKCPEGAPPKLGEKPEQHVQSFLLSHFDGLYARASVFVNEEVNNQGGRTDINIERPSKVLSRKVNTILELKVLSPTLSFNKNQEWAQSGVEQANKYRNHDTDAAFACLFDARRNKEDMPELPLYASKKDVRLLICKMDIPSTKKVKSLKLKEK
ncbi:hypothetical protein [Serratia sp. CY85251]|uniref:hypothetical protein n=1 Tax=Serratia sp. CY85251 TaxID=3383696 RepID=UPI003FA11EF4